LRVWDEKLLYELSDNRHELIKHLEKDKIPVIDSNKKQDYWVSGPNSETFADRFKYFNSLSQKNEDQTE
jgi:hypothetical protein